MNGKRGQLMGPYLVVATVFLMAVAIWTYLVQQENVRSSLVSPRPVLETYDNISLYEILEEEAAVRVAKELNLSRIGKRDYPREFRERFIKILFENEALMDLFFNNVWLDGSYVGKNERESFFRNLVYPNDAFDLKDGTLEISRGEVTKHIFLRKREGKNFPVEFYHSFSRKFSINIETNKIVGDLRL